MHLIGNEAEDLWPVYPKEGGPRSAVRSTAAQ